MKLYAMRDEGCTRPLVLGTVDGRPDSVTADYCSTHGWTLFTLEEAIARGALIRNRLGKEVWLGVNIKVKLEDTVLFGWWLGKWRPIGHYPYNRIPSNAWVQNRLERIFRVNCPLDPETKILFHWV